MPIQVELGIKFTIDLAQLFQGEDELLLARESQLGLSGIVLGIESLILMLLVINTGFSYRLLSFPIKKLVDLLLRLFIGPLSREIWIIFL